jgi:hypothetical protein
MDRSNLKSYGVPNPWPPRTPAVAMCRPASRGGTTPRPVLDCALVASVVVRIAARTAGTGLLAFLDCVSRGGQRRDGAGQCGSSHVVAHACR